MLVLTIVYNDHLIHIIMLFKYSVFNYKSNFIRIKRIKLVLFYIYIYINYQIISLVLYINKININASLFVNVAVVRYRGLFIII